MPPSKPSVKTRPSSRIFNPQELRREGERRNGGGGRFQERWGIPPSSILSLHHVVNDTLDGKSVAVTHCMLADSAILYSRRIGQNSSLLAPLGTFYYGNLVMYDLATDSYWLQLRGECFYGDHRGKRLENLETIERTSWSVAKQFERVNVLPPQGEIRHYREFLGSVKGSTLGLDSLKQSMEPDGRLPPSTRGLGVVIHGEARFFPLAAIEKHGILEDSVGGWSVLLVRVPEVGPTLMFRRYLDGRELSFRRSGNALIDKATGSRWSLRGICLEGRLAGKRLDHPAYTQAFWYAWAAFFPKTSCRLDENQVFSQ